MTIVALTNFITFATSSGKVVYRFQNSKPGQEIVIAHQGRFSFLSFIYQGAAKSRSGDNIESNIVLANNQIAMSYCVQGVRERWQVRVDTAVMNPDNFSHRKTLTTEYWIVANMAYDAETIELTLASSIDAVGANAPTRVLTKKMVGSLPSTGQIQNR